MKFPFSWLKELLPLDHDAKSVAETLTLIGIEVEAIESQDHDQIFHVGLTPNLGYAANLLGIARELSSVTGIQVKIPSFHLKEESANALSFAKLSVKNTAVCPRYLARIITDVKVGPSPEWLVKRLEACGARSVNNIVDITNYVLFLCGQPLHAFDLQRLDGREITVRNAINNEKIVTLDGKEQILKDDILLICDAHHPLAIAGVMGSLNSEVTEQTTSILLESAYFEPASVRKTSKALGIHTEASHRFERGVDPNGLHFALDYAAALIQNLGHGKVASSFLETSSQTFPPKELEIRMGRVNRLLGTSLALSEIETILKRAGGEVKKIQGETITLAFPTYRVDLREEIDLIEEVARLYGYKNIFEMKKPAYYQSSKISDHKIYRFEKEVRERLLREGLQELLTCDLISPEEAHLLKEDIPSRFVIEILNPGSMDQSCLRPSLFPNMLRVVKYNQDHQTHSLSGFEIGRIHFKRGEEYLEPTMAAVILSGKKGPGHFEKEVDFFDLKGILENLFASLNIGVDWSKSHYKNFHPMRQAAIKVQGHECGIAGEVHPKTLKKMDIASPLYFAEFNLEDLFSSQNKEIKMKPLSPFPSSLRDWTIKVASSFSAGDLLRFIEEERSKLLEEFSLLDVYQSEKLGSEWKNMTFRFVYRDPKQTISLKSVEEEHARIIQNVMKKIKIEDPKE